MRRELDKLELPSGYTLLEESTEGTTLGYGATPRIRRNYRSPGDFDSTCEEIGEAARKFGKIERALSKRTEHHITACSVTFHRRSFFGGITALSPLDADYSKRLGIKRRDFVEVQVKLSD